MIKSVRFRITLWYAAALAVTLTLFSVLVYDNLARRLEADSDQLLAFRAEGVADALETYLETELLETGKSARAAAKGGTFLHIAQELVKLHADDPRQAAVGLRILDSAGRELESSGGAMAPELPENTLREALKGSAVFDTIRIQDEDRAAVFRSYATPASGPRGAVYIVQTYRSTYHAQFALRSLRLLMAALVPLIVLLTGALGMFFARVALRPVADMAKTMRQITAENLSLRLNPPHTHDEIRELADLFNAMLARLEDSFQSERRLIQDVSHELKTPLTILKGELEVALKRARSAGEYAAILQSNLEETEKLSSLVEALLTLARFDNREVRLDHKPVDLAALLADTAAKISGVAAKAGVRLETRAAPGLGAVRGDEAQLGRLFLILLDNAVKFSPQGGAVLAEVRPAPGGAAATVTDEGPGIKPGDMPYIFKRFYRGDSSRSSAGFGLGLAIAKSIADAHGAAITADNAPGKGARFTVLFPPAA